MVIANSISGFTFFADYSPHVSSSLVPMKFLHLFGRRYRCSKQLNFRLLNGLKSSFYRFICLLCQRQAFRTFLRPFSALISFLGKKDHTLVLFIAVCIFIFTSFLYNPSFADIQTMGSWWERYGLWGAYIFPIILFIYVSVAQWFQGGKKK
ncbi:MAG: hypothetical protein KatS3mg080_0942 [Anoxybacillus sp.]|nr:MAG: hypothetical protein KatS3mg080_0942 [Anoxybacillus sp.]